MVNVVKERKGETLIVQFIGSIEENANFANLVGQIPKELHVNCKGVTRINSEGVKQWIKYFQAVQQKGVNLKFTEVSTVMIEQVNLISNFFVGAPIESFYAPYSCSVCTKEYICLIQTANCKADSPPQQKCPQCNVELAFDDIVEEYFGFIAHT
jgi:anti-anti-sigma regulatory factor